MKRSAEGAIQTVHMHMDVLAAHIAQETAQPGSDTSLTAIRRKAQPGTLEGLHKKAADAFIRGTTGLTKLSFPQVDYSTRTQDTSILFHQARPDFWRHKPTKQTLVNKIKCLVREVERSTHIHLEKVGVGEPFFSGLEASILHHFRTNIDSIHLHIRMGSSKVMYPTTRATADIQDTVDPDKGQVFGQKPTTVIGHKTMLSAEPGHFSGILRIKNIRTVDLREIIRSCHRFEPLFSAEHLLSLW